MASAAFGKSAPSRFVASVFLGLFVAGALLLETGCFIGWMAVWVHNNTPPGAQGTVSASGISRAASAATAGAVVFIPASAHVSGAQGTNWKTDIEVENPGSARATFTIALLKSNQANPSPQTRSFGLDSGRCVRYVDALSSLFGFSGSAALRITVDSGMVAITSRTYNDTPSGTYGQFIDGLLQGTSISEGQEGRIIQLSHSRSSSSGYRTNIGFVNTTGADLALSVELYLSDGTLVGGSTYMLGPYEFRQIDKIFETSASAEVADGYAVLSTPTAGGAFFAYASVIDNRTGDPIYITPSMRQRGVAPPAAAAQGAGQRVEVPAGRIRSLPIPEETRLTPAAVRSTASMGIVYIPATAHVTGAQGTNWRTDLEIHNPGGVQGRYEIALLQRNQDNSSPQTRTVTVEAGRSLRLEDVLSSQFGFTGAAALRITPAAGEAIVTSRTYNLTTGGTYGQFIPGVDQRTALVSGERALQIQLSHKPGGGAGFRTNIGLLNCTGGTIVVDAAFFNSSGSSYGTKSYTLKPYEFIQVDKIFEAVTGSDVADGYVVLSSTTAGARFMGYASIIDNRTGDPVFSPAIPVLSQEPALGSIKSAADATMLTLGLLGQGGNPAIVDTVSDIQQHGMETYLDGLVSQAPDVVTRIPQGLRFALGNHFILPDGSVASGTLDWSYDNLVNSGGRLAFDGRVELGDVLWNGQYSDLDTVSQHVDLTTSSGGLAGDVSISGSSATALRSTGATGTSVTGAVHLDTSVCANYPTSGSITFTRDGETHTITFTGACDGSYDYQGPGQGGQPGNISFRLTWSGRQDLNLYVKEPSSEILYWFHPASATGGRLNNAQGNEFCDTHSSNPEESVSWPPGAAPRGTYEVWAGMSDHCDDSSWTAAFTIEVYDKTVLVKTFTGSVFDDDVSPHYTYVY